MSDRLSRVTPWARALAVVLTGVFASAVNAASVWINEFHYDNVSTDSGEAIELAGTAGTDLTNWSVVLYNGNGGAAYDTTTLSGTLTDQSNGFGFLVLSYPVNGIQNGAPDGIALVDDTNTVIQFLSYEGAFAATDGPANGLTSTDIGVSEDANTAVGDSLQLVGSGSSYADFSWASEQPNTFGAVNTGQSFVPLPPAVSLFGSGLLGLISMARRNKSS